MTRATVLSSLPLLVTLLGGCSGDDEAGAGRDEAGAGREHVWKEKTGTIDRARDVERRLDEAASRRGQSQ